MKEVNTLQNDGTNTDFEVDSLDSVFSAQYNQKETSLSYVKYFLAGIFFGIILVKAEVISWFRIQEMFRLQSFHMYGVIGSAIVTGIISIWLIQKFNIKTIYGEPIIFHTKKFNKGQVIGGVIFGLGWAMTGACPGPLFAQIGAGFFTVIVVLL